MRGVRHSLGRVTTPKVSTAAYPALRPIRRCTRPLAVGLGLGELLDSSLIKLYHGVSAQGQSLLHFSDSLNFSVADC